MVYIPDSCKAFRSEKRVKFNETVFFFPFEVKQILDIYQLFYVNYV